MKRRSAASDSDGAALNEEHRLLRRTLQSRRGSRLRHHFSSITLPKHMSMSLALLRSILVIYITAICCNDVALLPMVDAASNGMHCTSRAAFCSHNSRQATPLRRSGELGNIRPLSTSQVELGQHFRTISKRSGNGCFPVISFPSSSTSALGVTDKQSSPEETIDVNEHTTTDSHGSHALENKEIRVSFEGLSEPPIVETDLHSISTHNHDIKSETSDTVARKQERAFLARVAVLFSIVVLSVLKMSPSGSWRYYLAGGICASTSHAITTPIDVVKVSTCFFCLNNF